MIDEQLYLKIVPPFLDNELLPKGFKRKGNQWYLKTESKLIKVVLYRSRFGALPQVSFGMILKTRIREDQKFGIYDFHFQNELLKTITKSGIQIPFKDLGIDWSEQKFTREISNIVKNMIVPLLLVCVTAEPKEQRQFILEGKFDLCYLRFSEV